MRQTLISCSPSSGKSFTISAYALSLCEPAIGYQLGIVRMGAFIPCDSNESLRGSFKGTDLIFSFTLGCSNNQFILRTYHVLGGIGISSAVSLLTLSFANLLFPVLVL